MPKGVEHGKPLEQMRRMTAVILALMPKGVEHAPSSNRRLSGGQCVILALMPKGVEHRIRSAVSVFPPE